MLGSLSVEIWGVLHHFFLCTISLPSRIVCPRYDLALSEKEHFDNFSAASAFPSSFTTLHTYLKCAVTDL